MSQEELDAWNEAQLQLAIKESLEHSRQQEVAALSSPLPRTHNVDANCWVNAAAHTLWASEPLRNVLLAEGAPAWMRGDAVALALRRAFQAYRADVAAPGETPPLSLEELLDLVTKNKKKKEKEQFAGGMFKRGEYADAGDLVGALLNHLADLGADAAAAVDRSVGLETVERGDCRACDMLYRLRPLGATRLTTLAYATLRDQPPGAGRLTRALLVQNSSTGRCEGCNEMTPLVVSLCTPPRRPCS
jgi:hypothetical protein